MYQVVILFLIPVRYPLTTIFKTIARISCLWGIYYLSVTLVKLFHIPLPGSVLGMIILFGLLSSGVIKEQWLTAVTTPLLKHLTFFFIPIAVELMQWGDLFKRIGYLLILPLVISLVVALVTTGGIVQLLTTSSRKKGGEMT